MFSKYVVTEICNLLVDDVFRIAFLHKFFRIAFYANSSFFILQFPQQYIHLKKIVSMQIVMSSVMLHKLPGLSPGVFVSFQMLLLNNSHPLKVSLIRLTAQHCGCPHYYLLKYYPNTWLLLWGTIFPTLPPNLLWRLLSRIF